MAITANGTTFSFGGTAIGDVLSISGPSVSVATIDTTSIGDTFRSFLGGTIDSGEVSLEIMYDPGSTAGTALETEWESTASSAPAAAECIITFSDSSTYTFQGILTGFEASAAIDDKVTANCTFKVSGSVAIA
jgi:hypothetical protein|tara:strand:+ start:412 stop:810 length:399 start_codon:yes stop_codon:yes gene_type:complete